MQSVSCRMSSPWFSFWGLIKSMVLIKHKHQLLEDVLLVNLCVILRILPFKSCLLESNTSSYHNTTVTEKVLF